MYTHNGTGLISVAGQSAPVSMALHVNDDGTWSGLLMFEPGSEAETLLDDATVIAEGPPTLYLNGRVVHDVSEVRVVDVNVHGPGVARIVGVGPRPF